MFQLQLFFLLHCDEWDRVVALPRHKLSQELHYCSYINPTTIGNSLVVTTTLVTILGCGYGKKCPPLFVYAWIITYTDSQHVINFLTISTTELLLSIRAVTICLPYDTMRIAIQGS